jgi:hypothetical protein
MKLDYYWAVFKTESSKGSEITLQVCDKQSHPFIWMRIQKEMYANEWICLNWKVISEEEFEYYKDTVNGRY